MQSMCDGRVYFGVGKLGNLTVTGIPADFARNEATAQNLSFVEPDRDPRGFMKREYHAWKWFDLDDRWHPGDHCVNNLHRIGHVIRPTEPLKTSGRTGMYCIFQPPTGGLCVSGESAAATFKGGRDRFHSWVTSKGSSPKTSSSSVPSTVILTSSTSAVLATVAYIWAWMR